MTTINFNHKTFSLLENSANGTVNTATMFEYRQEGDLVTATYHGGSIRYGKIIAVLKGHQLEMVYQCLTVKNELKAGKASAEISHTEHQKMKLKLYWEWLDGGKETGVSEYLEN